MNCLKQNDDLSCDFLSLISITMVLGHSETFLLKGNPKLGHTFIDKCLPMTSFASAVPRQGKAGRQHILAS